MNKEVFYVSIKNFTYQRCATREPAEFKFYIEPHKARVFQKLFQQMYRYESINSVPVNGDAISQQIDRRYQKVYAFIHS